MTIKEAIKVLKEYLALDEDIESEYLEAQKVVIKAMEQESKIGDWITKSHGFPPEPTSVCSECGFDRDFNIYARGFKKIKYCPNCGAKMEWSEEE